MHLFINCLTKSHSYSDVNHIDITTFLLYPILARELKDNTYVYRAFHQFKKRASDPVARLYLKLSNEE